MKNKPRSPRDTTKDNPLFLLVDAMAHGSSESIERMEAEGQRQLVNSDVLPVQIMGATEADFETLGFRFGEPVADGLFRSATLPEGWEREGSDHSMWSYVVDREGKRRVGIFYKAAFYDRDAFMSLEA